MQGAVPFRGMAPRAVWRFASNEENMSIYWDSFRTFFRIGFFTIGGGYAMIPLIEADVVDKNKWVAREEFLDLMAIAQSCPGIFAVNMSIFIGYKLRGVRGSVVCALGTVLPSFLIILGIALFFQHFQENETVQSIFKGIRPAVVGLLAAAALLLLTPENFSTPDNPWQFYISIFLFAFAFIGSLVYKMNPIKLICFCGLAGWILF